MQCKADAYGDLDKVDSQDDHEAHTQTAVATLPAKYLAMLFRFDYDQMKREGKKTGKKKLHLSAQFRERSHGLYQAAQQPDALSRTNMPILIMTR